MKNMKNENAVSPVIGVILMVVITVIIAAVLAVFAFGVGAPEKEAPDAALKIPQATTDGILIAHGGGDSILIANLQGMVDLDASDPTDTPVDVTAGITVNDAIGGASNNYWDPGETATITGATLTEGNLIRVTLIDTESGKPVMDATVRVTASTAGAAPTPVPT